MPLEAHIKEHPTYFKRFEAVWTPTILVMDSEGVERYRIEGYLPTDWFGARLELGLARVSFMHKKFADAQKKLQGLMRGFSTDGPQTIRVKIYLAKCQGGSGKLQEAVTELEALIAGTSDKDLLSLAYNALGDCYRSNGRNKEALWPYLWVDVIYHHDRDEHRKAMEQLARLFEELGDRTRARQYRERLKRENK